MATRWSSRVVIERNLADNLRTMHRLTSVLRLVRWLHTGILFALPLWSFPVAQAAPVSDEYLSGYIASVLERELHWPRDRYALQVEQGAAIITLRDDGLVQRAQATEHLQRIDGLQSFSFRTAVAGRDTLPLSVNSTDDRTRGAVYPVGDLFRPLLADPRQPNFFLSLREYDMPAERITTITAGFGGIFGLYRSEGRVAGDGTQISLDGGLFALFNLDEQTRELVNADYSIGVPLTWRQGDTSARLRLYHQSSHLGDGYLQRVAVTPLLLSYEALSVLSSHEWQGLRAYLGGEYRFNPKPDSLKRAVWQGGVEYYSTRRLWGGTRLVAAIDVKSLQQHRYEADINVQYGLESGGSNPGQRRLRVVLEGYRGHSPDGQLFSNFITAYGIGVYFGL